MRVQRTDLRKLPSLTGVYETNRSRTPPPLTPPREHPLQDGPLSVGAPSPVRNGPEWTNDDLAPPRFANLGPARDPWLSLPLQQSRQRPDPTDDHRTRGPPQRNGAESRANRYRRPSEPLTHRRHSPRTRPTGPAAEELHDTYPTGQDAGPETIAQGGQTMTAARDEPGAASHLYRDHVTREATGFTYYSAVIPRY